MGTMQLEIYTVEISIDKKVQTQQLRTIPMMAAQQFKQLVLKLSCDPRPSKVKFSKQEEIWLMLSQKYRVIESSVEFQNKSYGGKEK